MLPLDVLLILFAAGVWVYCLIDAIMTPRAEMRRLSPLTWAILITVLPVVGAVAWLLAGRPARSWRAPMMPYRPADGPRIGPAEALRRHPSGRSMELSPDSVLGDPFAPAAYGPPPPLGPDDDPDFLAELDQRLREQRDRDSD
jgi:Phospholipase_D-nuclease N-terminal